MAEKTVQFVYQAHVYDTYRGPDGQPPPSAVEIGASIKAVYRDACPHIFKKALTKDGPYNVYAIFVCSREPTPDEMSVLTTLMKKDGWAEGVKALDMTKRELVPAA